LRYQELRPVDYCVLMRPCRPRHTLFPYTTLFRSTAYGPWSRATTCRACASGSKPSATSPRTTSPTSIRHLASTATRRPTSTCPRSEEHTSELQSREKLVCRLLLEKKNK